MHRNKTCPICREDIPNKPLRISTLLCELLEEVEVRCKYGVKMVKPNSSRFGLLGSDFVAVGDMCNISLPLKDIMNHEKTCPYNNTLPKKYADLQKRYDILAGEKDKLEEILEEMSSENESLQKQVLMHASRFGKSGDIQAKKEKLERKVAQLESDNKELSRKLQHTKESYERFKLNPILEPKENYSYSLSESLDFAKFLLFTIDEEPEDANRCFVALQRLSSEWDRAKYDYSRSSSYWRNVTYMFHTARLCSFWSEKQAERIEEFYDASKRK